MRRTKRNHLRHWRRIDFLIHCAQRGSRNQTTHAVCNNYNGHSGNLGTQRNDRLPSLNRQ